MLLTFSAYFIIPIYTLLFVSDTDWFAANLSVIGNWPDRRFAFMGLGLIIGLYFHTVLRRLTAYLPRHEQEDRLAHGALLLLLLAVATPYLPERMPFKSFLHIVFAFLASMFLLFCLYRLIWRLASLSGEMRLALRPYKALLLAITAMSALLLSLAGIISSLLEVFFIISATILTQRLYRQFTYSFRHSRYSSAIRRARKEPIL